MLGAAVRDGVIFFESRADLVHDRLNPSVRGQRFGITGFEEPLCDAKAGKLIRLSFDQSVHGALGP